MTNEIKHYDGIQTGKRFDEYSEQELAVLPPIPEYKSGEDYPEYYDKAPLYWDGHRWQLIFE